MARVVIRSEVLAARELQLVPDAKLKEALRLLEREPTRGKPLTRELAGCRSLRIGGSETRLIYRLLERGQLVEVLAIGRRREGESHDTAARRM